MTEWEKMQQGLVYNDFDRDLFDRRVEAKKLFREYNRTSDDEVDKRLSLMRRLFKSGSNPISVVNSERTSQSATMYISILDV